MTTTSWMMALKHNLRNKFVSLSTHPSQSYQDAIGESFPAQPSNHTQPNSGVTGESQCKFTDQYLHQQQLENALHQN